MVSMSLQLIVWISGFSSYGSISFCINWPTVSYVPDSSGLGIVLDSLGVCLQEREMLLNPVMSLAQAWQIACRGLLWQLTRLTGPRALPCVTPCRCQWLMQLAPKLDQQFAWTAAAKADMHVIAICKKLYEKYITYNGFLRSKSVKQILAFS